MARASVFLKFSVLIISAVLTFALSSEKAFSNPQLIEVNGPLGSAQLTGKIEYYLDDTNALNITEVSAPGFAGSFQTVTSEFIDFGFTKSAIWLKFSLKNTTTAEDRFLLFFRENFFPQFSVYQSTQSGTMTAITELVENSVFDERPVAYPFLVAPVEAGPEETINVFVRYNSGGSSEVRFSIETEESFRAISNATVSKNSIFYGMLALMFIVSAAVFAFSLRPVFFAYSASTLTSLFLIMHLDGTGFQYIWSSFPQINADASLYLALFSMFFGSMFGRAFLQTKRYHRYVDKVFLLIMASSVIGFAIAFFADTQYLKWLVVLLFPFTHLWYMIAGLNAARTRFKEVRFYVIAWTGVFIGSGLLLSREIIGVEMTEAAVWDALRFVSVADAAFMGLGLLDRFNQLRIASQDNLRARLREAKQNLQLTQRLSDLEKQFETVTRLAENRDEQMMNTVHDLRQPLHALRLKVHDLMQGNTAEGEDFDSVKQTFSYLEGLVSDRLASTSGDVTIHDETADQRDDNNALSTHAILSGVYDMFDNDAREKGIVLEYTGADAELDFDQLGLMRIVSNLVSNAIKYTDEGEVRFGLSTVDGKTRLSVADSGTGMTQKTFQEAMQRNVRLEGGAKRANGNGYGLSIVHEIAQEHGLDIALVEGRAKGTEIEVTFPENVTASSQQQDKMLPTAAE